MSTSLLSDLDDNAVMRGFYASRLHERRASASLLFFIAEIDARHLYLRAGFESMRAFCIRELHLSEDAAAKRIQVARLARELPALFPAIADGRLHIGAVRTLASRLTATNVDDMIAAAANKSIAGIEVLLAQRFPQSESLRIDDGISPQVIVPDAISHATWHAKKDEPPASIEVAPRVRTKITPLSPERYTLQVTLPADAHDKLRRAQELLGHAVPSGDVVQVLVRALDALLRQLEKRKFGVATKPRAPRHGATTRCIPSKVRSGVYRRDHGACAFIHENGRACGSRQRLEFDHVRPVAKGGKSTVENLRLVCRAHNQYEAERAFGRQFIRAKKLARRAAIAAALSKPAPIR